MTNYLGAESYLQSEYTLAGRPFKHVVTRLDSLLMVLKSCYGKECHDPWQTIHPQSKVKNLKFALDPDFDAFYESQPKVSYSSCELGYLVDAEGPQRVRVFGDEELMQSDRLAIQELEGGRQRSFRYQGHWSWWT